MACPQALVSRQRQTSREGEDRHGMTMVKAGIPGRFQTEGTEGKAGRRQACSRHMCMWPRSTQAPRHHATTMWNCRTGGHGENCKTQNKAGRQAAIMQVQAGEPKMENHSPFIQSKIPHSLFLIPLKLIPQAVPKSWGSFP